MSKTLGSATFIWNGISQDYSFLETLECLYELSDEISIVYGGTDGTKEAVLEWCRSKNFGNNEKVIQGCIISEQEWEEQKGREKLSYFSNLAIDMLTADFFFYLQADEILHEDSFPYIRQAIEHDVDGYIVSRYNLWKTPLQMLNVPQERKPCSSEVIRLAKNTPDARCYDDAESLRLKSAHIFGLIDTIEIFHMGFVRNEVKHLVKIENMLTKVFGWEMDKKLVGLDKFDPNIFFSDADLAPIPKPLPKFIKQWCQERYPNLRF